MKNKLSEKINNNESGAVAILSVIFFMIMLSVLVVSFVRIAVNESQQTRDNELSASALAAAQAGVEDAKRILVHCSSAPKSPECSSINKTDHCDDVISSFSSLIKTEPLEGIGSLEGVIDNALGEYQQRYSCLQIETLTDNIDGIVVSPGKSEIIPLKMLDASGKPPEALSGVILSWHNVASDLDGAPENRTGAVNESNKVLMNSSDWSSAGYPAVMRIELVTVPKETFKLDKLTNDARAVTLVPATGGLKEVKLNDYLQNTEPNATEPPIEGAYCKYDTTKNYACEIKFSLGGGLNLSVNDYYLRLTTTYRSAHIQLVPGDEGVKFDGVQPRIDVTGRTNDVFRRLEARVRLNPGNVFFPEYALESGAKVCKDMFVTSDPQDSIDKCQY